jgi:DNA-directed RNA polymerase subunit RPC12/RpoP
MPVLAKVIKQEVPQAILPMHETSKPISFDHLRHTQVECTQCHHKNDQRELSFTSYKCASCHSTERKDKADDAAYYNIIHGRNALDGDLAVRCMSCHINEQKKQNKDKPSLTGCTNSGCHK